MANYYRHIVHQAPVIASLGGTAMSALLQRFRNSKANGTVQTLPGSVVDAVIRPRPAALIKDYVRNVGGDPSGYRGVVPPHMFPQWGFPLAAKTLRGIPYPLMRVMNGGCRLEVNAPLPAGERLRVSARLVSIDDDGRRAVLHQRITTGTESNPEAVVAHLYAIVPHASRSDGHPSSNGMKKDKPRVPRDVREVAYWRLSPTAGRDFAILTGDFNPIHWVKRYARASGFKSTILHGFATMARAIEGLNRGLFAGDTCAIRVFDVKFTRPLLLPARVGLYVANDRVYVGDAPGGPAYMVGRFQTEQQGDSQRTER